MTLEDIFCEIMEQEELPDKFEDLAMGDIVKWDSLANMNLLMALEIHLNVRFSFEEMSELNSIALKRSGSSLFENDPCSISRAIQS